MADVAALWELTKAAGLVCAPALTRLAAKVAEDSAETYVKAWFKTVTGKIAPDARTRAVGRTLRDLLKSVENEFELASVRGDTLEARMDVVGRFLEDREFIAAVQEAFSRSDSRVDAILLARAWTSSADAASALPSGFQWSRIAADLSASIHARREEVEELRDALMAQAAKEIAESAGAAVDLPANFDVDRYPSTLRQKFGRVDVQGLDVTAAYVQVQLWSVFVPQSVRECETVDPRLLEMPKERQAELRGAAQWASDTGEGDAAADARRREFFSQPMRPVLELFGDRSTLRVVILGDPGAGKSALLRFVALEWAGIEDPGVRLSRPLPLHVDLRSYTSRKPKAQSITEFLMRHASERIDKAQLERALRRTDGAVLLLDGLDEVFDPSDRANVAADIARVANDYPNLRIAVTSRVLGYDPSALRGAGFRHFLLQDLEGGQIERFLRVWHEETVASPAERDEHRDRLLRAIQDSPPVQQLAGNPLLLTMMAILNRNHELPRNRTKLYGQAAELLLTGWEARKPPGEKKGVEEESDDGIDFDAKRDILQAVACQMQEGGAGCGPNWIERPTLERMIREYLSARGDVEHPKKVARVLVDQLRDRNFVLCSLGDDKFGFVHRTFQEYFCAGEYVRRLQEDGSLSFDELFDRTYRVHWNDDAWQEVLTWMARPLGAASVAKIVDRLLHSVGRDDTCRHRLLAARCFAEVPNPGALTAVREPLLRALKATMRFDLPYHTEDSASWRAVNETRIAGLRALVASRILSDPQAWLLKRAERSVDWCLRLAATEELARGFAHDATVAAAIRRRAERDWSEAVRRAAVRELARSLRDDPDTSAWLEGLVTRGETRDVREEALRALARGRGSDPRVIAILRDQIAHRPLSTEAAVAFEELGRIEAPSPADLERLLEIAADAEARTGEIPDYVIEAIGGRHGHRADARAWLRRVERRPVCDHTRRTATQAFSEIREIDDERLAWCDELLFHRLSADDRERAVALFARGRRYEPRTLPRLFELGAHDRDTEVRCAAVREAARGWADDPRTLAWLLRCARRDPERDVRESAVKEIARAYGEGEEVRAELIRVAEREGGPVLWACIRTLMSTKPRDAQTLRWLQATIPNDWSHNGTYAIAREIADGWGSDQEIREWFFRNAKEHEDSSVRAASFQALMRHWRDDPRTHEIALTLTETGTAYTRRQVIAELAHGWPEDGRTRAILAEAVRSDEHDIAQAAIEALDRSASCPSADVGVFVQAVLESPHAFVRRTALYALGRLRADDSEIGSLLLEQARRMSGDPRRALENLFLLEVAFQYFRTGSVAAELLVMGTDRDPMNTLQKAVAADFIDARPELVEWLHGRFFKHSDPRQRAHALWAAALIRPSAGLPLMRMCEAAIANGDPNMRDRAVDVISRHCPNEAEVVRLLEPRVKSDPSKRVRNSCLYALANRWRDSERFGALLERVAVADDSADVRRTALHLLARILWDRKGLSEFLRERHARDADASVKEECLQSLVSSWSTQPDTRAFVEREARQGEHASVRARAIELLTDWWRTAPSTLEILCERAAKDDDADVREKALFALARHWSDDPRVVGLILERTKQEPEESVRRRMIDEVVRECRDDPRTVSTLRAMASGDSGDYARSNARQVLAHHWSDDPEVTEFLSSLEEPES